MRKNIRQYNGLGFVEALIALTVAGVVGIVLMGISAEAIRELRKIDMQDAIAQHAVSTAVHVQNLAIEEAINNPEENAFTELQVQNCYLFNEDGEITAGGPQNSLNRSAYMDSSLVAENSEYFRIMCVEYKSGSDNRRVLVKIIVGSNRVEGKATTRSDVKDYEYFSIINI